MKPEDSTPTLTVAGTIVEIDKEFVLVHAGLKFEGVIPRSQLLNEDGEFSHKVGDQVQVKVRQRNVSSLRIDEGKERCYARTTPGERREEERPRQQELDDDQDAYDQLLDWCDEQELNR